MLRIREIMQKHLHMMLTNWQYALLCTLILALFPYTSWLSVVSIAFITLRKGLRDGAMLVIPVAAAYFGCSLIVMSAGAAIINALVLFVPCFLAAYVLRVATTWQAVFSVFFVVIGVVSICIQLFAPEFVIAQYLYLESFLKETQADTAVVKLLAEAANINQAVIASYAFGLQMLSIIFSATMALMAARSIQSRLYNVGGFKQEILNFRAHKIGVLLLIVLFIAGCRQNMIAMMLLPAVILYFVLAGLSVSANILHRKNQRLLLLLLIPLILMPFVAVPFYSLLGLFEGLLNLRLYILKPRKRG
jgi:hypothetical protein